MLLVGVHPWDIDGAGRAGMSGAWINRLDLLADVLSGGDDIADGDLGTPGS
jgi:hypothetical protein